MRPYWTNGRNFNRQKVKLSEKVTCYVLLDSSIRQFIDERSYFFNGKINQAIEIFDQFIALTEPKEGA